MKIKRNSVKAILLTLALAFMVLTITSCGGYQNSSTITASDYLGGKGVSINIRTKNAMFGGTYDEFALPYNIEELGEIIESSGSNWEFIDTEVFGNSIMLLHCRSENETGVFMINQRAKREVDTEEEYRYNAFAPIYSVNDEISVYMPYHLFELIDIQLYSSHKTSNDWEAMEVNGDIDAFAEFYSAFEGYETAKSENSLTVKTADGYDFTIDFYSQSNASYAGFSFGSAVESSNENN